MINKILDKQNCIEQEDPLYIDERLENGAPINKTKDWALVHERGLGKWTVSLE